MLFLHGGGYFREIVRAHWRFIGYLTRNAGVRCVVPIYPLAPRATAKEVVPGTGELLRNPVQDIPGILEAGRLYAGDLNVAHPYVSPLNGDFRGLAPMIVFSGTHDLLYPDSIDLAAKARAAGVPIELHLRQGQPHNYARDIRGEMH